MLRVRGEALRKHKVEEEEGGARRGEGEDGGLVSAAEHVGAKFSQELKYIYIYTLFLFFILQSSTNMCVNKLDSQALLSCFEVI